MTKANERYHIPEIVAVLRILRETGNDFFALATLGVGDGTVVQKPKAKGKKLIGIEQRVNYSAESDFQERFVFEFILL